MPKSMGKNYDKYGKYPGNYPTIIGFTVCCGIIFIFFWVMKMAAGEWIPAFIK